LDAILIIVFLAAVIVEMAGRKKALKGGEPMEKEGTIEVGESLAKLESPLSSERSLALKRDKAVEKAARKASLNWKERKELRKSYSRSLLDLSQQTSDDLKDAIIAKLRSDLNFFVSAHQMRNNAGLEKLKLAFEERLTEAFAESSKARMGAKMRALYATIDRMDRAVEELKARQAGNGKHSGKILESFERLFQNTLTEIENINVRMSQPGFMKD
jgi:hypothetical protein